MSAPPALEPTWRNNNIYKCHTSSDGLCEAARDGIVADYRSIDNSLHLFMNLYLYLYLAISLSLSRYIISI